MAFRFVGIYVQCPGAEAEILARPFYLQLAMRNLSSTKALTPKKAAQTRLTAAATKMQINLVKESV